MSTRLIQRLEEIFEPIWHHHNPFFRKDCIMTALSRLAAAVGDLTTENKDLKKQLADAQAKPAGSPDADLDGITSQIEAALGHAVADPDAPPAEPDQAAPVVGSASTTVTAPDGSTTTLDHTTGEATTTDVSGATVATDPSAAAAAVSAAQAAGIPVPPTA